MARKIYNETMVLDAALALAKEVGFEKLSMRGVARQLGVSISPVYDAFESKEHLIEAIITKVIDENAARLSYRERNQDILSFGLRHPVLYRDIQMHTRNRSFDTTHPADVMRLMKADPRYRGLSDAALRSLNFDLLLYISGLVQLRLSDMSGELDDAYYHDALDAVSELLRIGYVQAEQDGRS